MYTVLPPFAVFMVGGDHVPFTPLLELTGKEAGAAFWQYGPKLEKVGVELAFTTTVWV